MEEFVYEFVYDNAPADSPAWFFALDLLYSHALLLPRVPLCRPDVELWLSRFVELEVGFFGRWPSQSHGCS